MEQIWEQIKEILASQLTKTAMDTWFAGSALFALQEEDLLISVPDELRKSVLTRRFAEPIRCAARELLCADCNVIVLTTKEAQTFGESETASAFPMQPQNGEFTFENYVVGQSNRFAFAAARKIAEGENGRLYNPLFLYGSSGLGKTHLLNAIISEIGKRGRAERIISCRGEDFTNRMLQALQDRKMNEFHEEFRNADLLLIDDIGFIAGKPATQEEFYNTFNQVYERGGHIVLTSDCPPKDLASLEARLRSRFEGGVLAEIQAPDTDLRCAYIRRKAEELHMELDDSTVFYLAERLHANFRQLHGALKSIHAYSDLLGGVTRDSLDRVIGKYAVSCQITPDRIIKETARYFSVGEDQIRGTSRERKPTSARQAAMYLCRSMLSMTLNEIGDEFKRDHATVLTSVKKAKSSSEKDTAYSEALQKIRLNLRACSC